MKTVTSPASKLSDVARLAGVGNATVSRVLNGHLNVSEEKVRKVKLAIQELGYRPNRIARSLKGASSGMIGMIVPSISDMFFSRCAEAVEIVAREQGSLLIVMASHDNQDIEFENLKELLNHRIDGLILSSAQLHNPRLHEALSQVSIPIVGLDRPLQEANLPSVMSENLEGAMIATEHLLGHGYKTVLCILVKPDLYTISERCKGYSQAMKKAGLKPLVEIVDSSEDVERCLSRHIRTARTTIAVFAANNLSARYVWEAIRKLHLTIPTQVAVLSFDDFDLADTLTPPMSVVQQPVEDLGRNAAALLFSRISGPKAGIPHVNHDPLRLPTRLVVRASCGCTV